MRAGLAMVLALSAYAGPAPAAPPDDLRDAQAFVERTYQAYCEGCEAFKTETEAKESGGICPNHQTPLVRRSEPCYFFELSKFQAQLLEY